MFVSAGSRPHSQRARHISRIVLYSHDTLGYGHLRRNLLIASALRGLDPAPDILMIAGMREAGAFELPPGVDLMTLPAYEKGSDGSYRPRDLGGDLPALVRVRAQAIQAAVLAFDPDLMIVDNVPRGAQTELDPLLEALKRFRSTRLVLGLRDVIDRPEIVRRQWQEQRNFEAIRDFYDDIWIYGDPSFYDLLKDCRLEAPLAGRGRFVGYLDHRTRLALPGAAQIRDAVLGNDPRPYILCAVGGGRDGAALCEAFLRAELPEGHRGILVTGSQMPGLLRDNLRPWAEAREDMMLLDFVAEPIALMAGAARIVAMGGYNTICEVLSLGVPSLIVPRVTPRAEQLLRAELLEERGLIAMLRPENLSAEALGEWMRAAPPGGCARLMLDMGAQGNICALAEQMLAQPHAPGALCAAS